MLTLALGEVSSHCAEYKVHLRMQQKNAPLQFFSAPLVSLRHADSLAGGSTGTLACAPTPLEYRCGTLRIRITQFSSSTCRGTASKIPGSSRNAVPVLRRIPSQYSQPC